MNIIWLVNLCDARLLKAFNYVDWMKNKNGCLCVYMHILKSMTRLPQLLRFWVRCRATWIRIPRGQIFISLTDNYVGSGCLSMRSKYYKL